MRVRRIESMIFCEYCGDELGRGETDLAGLHIECTHWQSAGAAMRRHFL